LPRRGDPSDAEDVPNIIRQTDANEYKDETFIPKVEKIESVNATTLAANLASKINLTLKPGVQGFGTGAIPNIATQTGVTNAKKKKAVDNNKKNKTKP
jgi:hypothetical protein